MSWQKKSLGRFALVERGAEISNDGPDDEEFGVQGRSGAEVRQDLKAVGITPVVDNILQYEYRRILDRLRVKEIVVCVFELKKN
jgi:hypothetical protein